MTTLACYLTADSVIHLSASALVSVCGLTITGKSYHQDMKNRLPGGISSKDCGRRLFEQTPAESASITTDDSQNSPVVTPSAVNCRKAYRYRSMFSERNRTAPSPITKCAPPV